ncbi:MAG: TolC family protein [Bacteroidales bacterium]|nr:TolC family protein [Bacteroidales bacterium]
MKRIIWITGLLILLIKPDVTGQEKIWTLEDCINYAVENNIGLQRQRLQTETAETNYLKSKMDLLPSLNLGSDARVGFGRSVDPVTNLITFKQNLSNSYSLNTNLQIFSGFATLNTISASKFLMKAGLESEKVVRNSLIVDILGQYYQVLYARGLEEAAKLQLDLSEKQKYRIVRMVENGREALSKQYEIESQVSSDRLAYTVALNSANQALTLMKQLLQLEPGEEFDVALPDLKNMPLSDHSFSIDSVFNVAVNTLPRLKAIEFELKALEKQIAAAKGGILPNLTVGGAVYTGYYKVVSEDAGVQPSFSDQIKNNNSQAVYLSVGIPIFNNYLTGRNIRIAKIRKNDTELRLEQERNSLYTEIENACLDYNRGRDEFLAAQSNHEFNIRSFDAVEKKFEAGLVDVTDYSAAKTTLYRAETEALRTKLQLLVRRLTISFYTTGEYENLIFN